MEGSVEQSFGDIATQYARDVVEGRIIACKWVKLAGQRHLKDLAKSEAGEWPYIFNPELIDPQGKTYRPAERVCRFAELMPHIKGDWAARGERIKLQPWQIFCRASIFGWIHRITLKRRFRVADLFVPRKNAKSTDASITGNYMLAVDGEFGAEVYSGATSQDQAMEVFRPSLLMARATPEFRQQYGVTVNASNLSVAETNSKFEPVIGKPGDGASPSCAIIDEFHEHKTPELYETMQTGMGARSQPLMLIITTAGTDVSGPCYMHQVELQKILEGTIENDQRFGIIFTIDNEAHIWIYRGLNALLEINRKCTCKLVSTTLIDQLWHEVCAAHVMNVSALENGLLIKSNAADNILLDGLPKIEESVTLPIKNGAKKLEQKAYFPLLENQNTESLKSNTKTSISFSEDAALFAEFQKKSFASITVTEQRLFEDCCAENVILHSDFSAMILKIYNAHSHTCKAHGFKCDSAGLYVEFFPDDWTSEEALIKANPNYGISVDADFLKLQQRDAVADPRKQNTFKTKHLNIWCAAASPWINLHNLQQCGDPSLILESFAGEECVIGLDLASKQDIASKVNIFRRVLAGKEHYYVISFNYIPEDAVNKPQNTHYQGWVHSGHLIATQGNMIDLELIQTAILSDGEIVGIREVAKDPYGGQQLGSNLANAGLEVVDIPQQVPYLSEPMKWIAALIDAGQFHHDGNPAFIWMMSNVECKPGNNESWFPRKQRFENKIDAAVALITGMNRAMVAAEQNASPEIFIL